MLFCVRVQCAAAAFKEVVAVDLVKMPLPGVTPIEPEGAVLAQQQAGTNVNRLSASSNQRGGQSTGNSTSGSLSNRPRQDSSRPYKNARPAGLPKSRVGVASERIVLAMEPTTAFGEVWQIKKIVPILPKPCQSVTRRTSLIWIIWKFCFLKSQSTRPSVILKSQSTRPSVIPDSQPM